jgi:hypothetical protein
LAFRPGPTTPNQELIRQSLLDLPEAVTTDAEMPALDALCDKAEDEAEWIPILLDIIPAMPLNHPLSGALIGIIVETLPNPMKKTLLSANSHLLDAAVTLVKAKKSNETTKRQRNLLILLGTLAERHAGPASEALFSAQLADCLLTFLQSDIAFIQLHALLAIEKFAKTGSNKRLLMDRNTAALLVKIENQICSQAGLAARTRRRGSIQEERLVAQLGFCVMWTLDNVFPCNGRQYTIDRTDVTGVNVMLDVKDATKHLKLAPGGLEARNDALSFESVRATCCAQASGVWYYEVTLFTSGIMQIGWATDRCTYKSEEGVGIGDDIYSFAYDGQRGLLWHRQENWPHEHKKWRQGDVLGVLLDLDDGRMKFSLNGTYLKKAFPLPKGYQRASFYPAASLMTFQHLEFNFGNSPYRHAPDSEFRSLNETGEMTAEEKRIIPRLVVLEQLRKEQLEEDDSPRCQICFDRPPCVELLPCKHLEFCAECSVQCEKCPLCRTVIEARVRVAPVFQPADDVDVAPASADDAGIVESERSTGERS